jgi:early secretory antigenic target protein ESAT-6
MANVLVTFSALANAAQSIQSTNAKLNSQLDDLRQLLGPIVADWSGEAAEGYQAQQQKWFEAQTDLNNVLQAIGRAVEEAHQAYTSTETTNARSWNA